MWTDAQPVPANDNRPPSSVRLKMEVEDMRQKSRQDEIIFKKKKEED